MMLDIGFDACKEPQTYARYINHSKVRGTFQYRTLRYNISMLSEGLEVPHLMIHEAQLIIPTRTPRILVNGDSAS